MINSGTRLIPDGFCFLDPLEELSILGNMLFHSMKGINCGIELGNMSLLFIETN